VATCDKVANEPLDWWKANAENVATPAVLALRGLFFFNFRRNCSQKSFVLAFQAAIQTTFMF
jgi:predicted negative regulator of RcsB-dependent stress response